MKKILLSVFSLGMLASATSQCTDIFISEYVEGSSNNKAIELYNPTASAINLTGYELRRYSNGEAGVPANNRRLSLGGTINAYSTYVIVLDKRDPQGTQQEAPVWDCLQAKADTFMSPVYNVNQTMYFNGDDGLALLNGTSLIDFFGVLGQRPADGWPFNEANINLSKDHSLIRRRSIKSGVTVPPALATDPNADFNPAIEWHDAERNRFRNLGTHECDCEVVATTIMIDTTYACNNDTGSISVNDAYSASINENNGEAKFSAYPNPSNTGNVTLVAENNISAIKIFNVLGTLIYDNKTNKNNIHLVNTSDWKKGLYFVSIRLENGNESTKKITIN